MARDFTDLLEHMTPERRQRIERRVRQIRTTPLYQLRRALHLTQAQVAEELGVGQAALSRFERRPDMYLSTLRRFVEAVGGELEVRARFPGGDVVITDFGEEDEAAEASLPDREEPEPVRKPS